MSEALFINVPQVSAGLTSGTDTLTYTIPSGAGGLYTVHVEVANPPDSSQGLSILVKNNGSTVYTAATQGQTQGAQQFNYTQLYAAADAVSIVLSSSTAAAKVANAVKAIVTIRQGL